MTNSTVDFIDKNYQLRSNVKVQELFGKPNTKTKISRGASVGMWQIHKMY